MMPISREEGYRYCPLCRQSNWVEKNLRVVRAVDDSDPFVLDGKLALLLLPGKQEEERRGPCSHGGFAPHHTPQKQADVD